jgi:flavodoxin
MGKKTLVKGKKTTVKPKAKTKIKPKAKTAVKAVKAKSPKKKSFKKLIVYYSLTGSTKILAQALAQSIKADLLEITLEKELPKKGFFKYLTLGTQASFGVKPAIKELKKNPLDYDIIIFGSPVWAGTYASPFNTFFSKVDIKGKITAFFCSYAGSSGSTLINFKKKLSDNSIFGEIGIKDFHYEKGSAEDAKKIICNWANNILKRLA